MPTPIGGATRSPTGRRRPFNWRVALVRTAANGAAVALTVAVLPGLRVTTERPVLGYLAIGAVFGLLNAFVKPAIQFVALPLLLGSFGLVVILVDALILWLLDILLRILSVDGIGALFAGAALVGVLGFLLDGVLGLTPPIIDDRPPPGKRAS
jgi:putative membrane protein